MNGVVQIDASSSPFVPASENDLQVRDRVPDALKRLVAVTLGNLAGGSSLPSFSSSPTATADRRRATVASSTPRGRAQSAVPTARPTAESLPSTVPSSILSGEPLLQHVSAARRCWISLAKTVTSSIFPDVLCYSFQACEELEGWKAGEGSFLPPALLLLDERCPVDTSVLFNHLLSYALNSEPRTAVNDTDVRKSVATILGSFIERIDTSLTPSTLRSLTRAFELIPREAQPSPAAEEIASLVSTSVVNLLDRLSGQPQHLDVLSHLAQCVLETYRKVPGKEGSLCRSWALDTLLKASVRSEGKPLGKALGYNLVVPLVHLLEGEDAKMSEFCADILRSLLHRPHSESFRAESLLLTPSSLDAHRSGFGQGLGGYGVLSRQLRLVLYSSAFRIISREDCSKVLSAHLGSLLLRVVEMFGNSDRGLFLSLFLSMLRERRSGDKVKSGIDASIIAIALLGLIKLGEAIGLDEHSRDQLLSALGGKDSLDAVRRKAALDVSGDGELLAFSETTPTSAVPFPRVDEASVVEVLGDASPSSEESTSGNTPSAKERPPAFRPLALPSTAKEPKARPPISKLLRKEGGSESVLLSSTEGDESEAEHEFQPKTAEELFQQSIRTGSLGKQVLLELLRSQDNPSHPSYSNASLDEAIAALQL